MPDTLVPAAELARRGPVRFPNESAEYRAARTALLAEEIELRRHIERVAAQRRALPPGGEVTGDYRFQGENGPASFAGLFGDKQTLVVYSYMFGPQRERPCPMCTNLLGGLDGNAADIGQRIALAVVARSPIERLIACKRERGWTEPPALQRPQRRLFARLSRRAAGRPEIPAFNVFTRRDGTIRHFWSGEMTGDRRSRPGSARRARPRAAVDRARHDARRARRGLVSEVELWGVRRHAIDVMPDRSRSGGKGVQQRPAMDPLPGRWPPGMTFSVSWPGLSRPSRSEKRGASRNGITGTRPVMTLMGANQPAVTAAVSARTLPAAARRRRAPPR